MKTLILALGAASAACLPALLDAFWRHRRATDPAPKPPGGARPGRVLALVPARAEGARMLPLCADLRSEGEAANVSVDVCVVLDGSDVAAAETLRAAGVDVLEKTPAGPSKGAALGFATHRLDAAGRIDAATFVLVFDADMRLADGFFRDLAVPSACEAFQLPVRPAGVPPPGAARVEAFSLGAARVDDLARDAEGLPVRLRGKAMGFSPRAWRLGPAAAHQTTAEDSEATLALAAAGVRLRALAGPFALDEPPANASAMAASRARWLGGHLKLMFTGAGNLLRLAVRSPKGAFTLAADLWLRPRLLVLAFALLLAVVADGALVAHSLGGGFRAEGGLAVPLAASAISKLTLVFEVLSALAVRQRLGKPPEIPEVTLSDLAGSLAMWLRAIGRALRSPSAWHRARPEA